MAKIEHLIENYRLIKEIQLQRTIADVLMEEMLDLYKLYENGLAENKDKKLVQDRMDEIDKAMGQVTIEMDRLKILTDIHQKEVNDKN